MVTKIGDIEYSDFNDTIILVKNVLTVKELSEIYKRVKNYKSKIKKLGTKTEEVENRIEKLAGGTD